MSLNESEHNTAVRITNADIYRLVSDTRERVQSLDQTVRDVLKPGLDSALSRLDAIDKAKADKELVVEARGRISTLEMRMYAIVSGLVAALLGGKATGIL